MVLQIPPYVLEKAMKNVLLTALAVGAMSFLTADTANAQRSGFSLYVGNGYRGVSVAAGTRYPSYYRSGYSYNRYYAPRVPNYGYYNVPAYRPVYRQPVAPVYPAYRPVYRRPYCW